MSRLEDNIYPDPNQEYDTGNIQIATWNTTTDVNQFCNKYNHDNKYNGLKLGQRIQINDGTYNKSWIIAGFDVESNKIASDGKSYDNGYGIALVPQTQLFEAQWHTSYTTNIPYINSSMHTSTLPTIANNLKKVLGNHLINRNVLLSSSVSTGKEVGSTAYTWTTAYCTLMSIGQMTGKFASYNNKYDDGEANYKLPLFDYMEYKTGYAFWSRGVWGRSVNGRYFAWAVGSDGYIGSTLLDNGYELGVGWTCWARPLIYIR